MKKKYIAPILYLGIILILCSCVENNTIMSYNSKEYIELYDYSTIYIKYSDLIITDNDIESIIETELSVNECYSEVSDRVNITENDILLLSIDNELFYYYLGTDALGEGVDSQLLAMKKGESKLISSMKSNSLNVTIKGIYRTASYEDTELILKFYKVSSLDELTAFITQRAKEEIVFNHMFEIIFKNSVIKNIPHEIQNLIDSDIEASINDAAKLESFLLQFDMEYEEYISLLKTRYYETMLYKAILDNEGIVISDKEIADFMNETTIRNNEYSKYDAYEELSYIKARKALINSVNISK